MLPQLRPPGPDGDPNVVLVDWLVTWVWAPLAVLGGGAVALACLAWLV